MNIWVSSLANVHDTARKAGAKRVVSLLSPGDVFPVIEGVAADNHHKVHLHDIREPLLDHVTPGERHVRDLITFLSKWLPDDPLLVHCWAGISRSTATAFIAACLHNPATTEKKIATAIRDASVTAFPNTLIVAHADAIMGRNGRMIDAVAAMSAADLSTYNANQAARPFSIPADFGGA